MVIILRVLIGVLAVLIITYMALLMVSVIQGARANRKRGTG